MSSQFLFAYGTLKSDQPEHAQHCAPPLSITPATAFGSLWRIREGYPLLEIDPSLALLDASPDANADWAKAMTLCAETSVPVSEATPIQGELFEYTEGSGFLRKMDAWENFSPGRKGTYQRRIIWVKDDQGQNRIAWAYVCFTPPDWATLLNRQSW